MAEYTDSDLRELDDLARQEAAERGEPYISPFDAAVAAASPMGADSSAPADQLAFGEVPTKRSHAKKGRATGGKRGRPRRDPSQPSEKRPRSHSAPVGGPPPPPAGASAPQSPPAAMPQAMTPQQLAPLLKQLDSMLSERIGTERLSDAEALEGAAVLGPILHHYMPMITESQAPWVPGALWVALAYGPRVMDRAQPARRVTAQAQESAAPSAATFRTPDAERVSHVGPEVVAPDAVAPIFRNPLEDLPHAPPRRLPL